MKKLLSKIKALLNYPYSYAYPIIKIILCLLYIIIPIIISYKKLLPLFIRIVDTIILMQVLYYLADTIDDFIEVSENRGKKDVKKEWTVRCGVKKIETILNENDIIELIIKLDKEVIRIGSSSCLDRFNDFSDKKYYISDCEYDTIDEFTEELKKIYPGGRVTICSIDGISPKKTKYFREE